MCTVFVYLRPLTVAYCRAHGPYATSSNEAWSRLFEWLEREGLNSMAGCGYGLMRDNPKLVPAAQCRYDGCVELPRGAERALPPYIGIQTLPGGAYGRERQLGLAGLRSSIARLRDEWAPANGLSVDASRPFMEIFQDNPALVPEEKRTIDLCVPVTVGQVQQVARLACVGQTGPAARATVIDRRMTS